MIQNTENKLITDILKGKLKPAGLESLFELATKDQAGKNLFELYLMILKKRGLSDGEVNSMVKLLLERARRISIPFFFMDVCGTGGDRSSSFNISTASAFVVAASGVPVLKHGNRSVSSRCGSSDLMELLGISLEKAAHRAKRTLSHFNFGYLHAPFFHPFLAEIADIRKRIGEPTVLNFLGPLLHPARPKVQLVGIGDGNAFNRYAHWLQEAGRRRALVVRGEGGLDEASPYGKTEIQILDKGKIRRETIRARDFGFKTKGPRELKVKSPQESLRVFRKVMEGKGRGGCLEAVLLNAGLGLLTAKRVRNLREGIEKARTILRSGVCRELIKKYRDETQ
jgi:anthranilate phosphoribosyltransferase